MPLAVASSSVLAFILVSRVRRPHWTFRGCRVHSELKLVLLLRPASWLALLTRTFTFELALAGSPRTGVEYDYVGKQSIPTTGLSPASPTALWAAGHQLSRARSQVGPISGVESNSINKTAARLVAGHGRVRSARTPTSLGTLRKARS